MEPNELNVNVFRDENLSDWYKCIGCGGILKYRPKGWMRIKLIKNNLKGGFEVYCRQCGEHNGWIASHPAAPPPSENSLF